MDEHEILFEKCSMKNSSSDLLHKNYDFSCQVRNSPCDILIGSQTVLSFANYKVLSIEN